MQKIVKRKRVSAGIETAGRVPKGAPSGRGGKTPAKDSLSCYPCAPHHKFAPKKGKD